MKNKLDAMLSFFILFFFISGIGLCRSELEWTTTYRIEIGDDGAATWTIERKTFFQTEYDEATFSYYSSLEYHYELSNNISELVKEASLKTGRWNMTNGPLTITSSIFRSGTVSYGVITYQYDWTEFANIAPNKDRIEIGDVFVNGIFLFGSGGLTMEYPSGYVVADAFPIPDEIREFDRTVIWRELEDFNVEDTNIVLRKKCFTDTLREYVFLIAGVIAAVSLGFAGLWLRKHRRKEEEKPIIPTGRTTLETEGDEEKVVRMLKASGGSLYQSTITKRCGFSKSKTSLLLTAMETRGKVKRQKKGRKKLVTLTEKDEYPARKDKGT